ncbi:SpdD-like protein [Streptomyces sp. HU2014]|uniref:SpdD-like protein n=1 Tax=Streptomyces sp. HU2014 TaxID=2939414 RepID=UPI00200D59E2|nr:SpdD-like protein [Streptomyces sp. HU2014]UQI48709.1 SpdD-like protein [Streptomyces sp. HU2014]
MLQPRVPVNPLPTTIVIPPAAPVTDDPAPVAPAVCQDHQPIVQAPARSGVQLTGGAMVAAIGGGTLAVLVVGAVLVGMLLAVSITAGSLAVVAVVVRSMLNGQSKR